MTEAPAILDSRYSWFRLCVTLLAGTVGGAGLWSVVIVLPAVQADFGAERGWVSVAYTTTMVGFALGNLVLGRILDRHGVVLVILAATVMSVAGYALAALMPSLIGLMVMQALIGVGASAFFGPLVADISHWFLRRRGIAVALVACGNYLAGALWPFLLGGLIVSGDWRSAYLVIAVALALTLPPLAMLLRRRLPEEAVATAAASAALHSRRTDLSPATLQALLVVAAVGCCVAMAMPQVHIVALCVDMGFGPAVGAEMLSMMLLAGVVSRIVSGFLADRLGGVRTLLIGSGLQCLALFLYLPADGLTSLYVVSIVFGLSQGGIVPSYAIIVREYMPPREAGARVGVVMMATLLGMALGGWMSGAIYDLTGSYTLAFVNGIVWNGLNIAIVLLLILRSRGTGPGARQVATAA